MSIAKKSALLFLPIVALSLQMCSAQAPSGEVSIPFGIDTPVFDLTGSYQLDQSIVGEGGTATDLNFGVYLNLSPGGALTGSGSTLVSVGDGSLAPFAATYSVTGRVGGGGAKAVRATFTVQLIGEDTVFGIPNTSIHISVAYNLTVDPTTLTLNGTARGGITLGSKGGRIKSAVGPLALPEGVDGTWTLQMHIVPLSTLGGSGEIVVGSVVNANAETVGRDLQTGLTGTYSAASNLAHVTLAGLRSAYSSGSVVSLSFTPDGTVDSMHGTILGQTVKIASP
jgi:hypothetical protein